MKAVRREKIIQNNSRLTAFPAKQIKAFQAVFYFTIALQYLQQNSIHCSKKFLQQLPPKPKVICW